MRRSLLVVTMLLACRAERGNNPHGGSAAARPAAPPVLGPVGSPHPITVIRNAANGRWIVACQARRDTDGVPGIRARRLEHGYGGDKLMPYLIRGAGDGIAIDGFVAASSDDRWLAVVRDGALVLIDDVSGHEQVLHGADVRGEWPNPRQVAAFDVNSTHVVYVSLVDGQSRVVVRELTTQAERAPIAVPGDVWQVREQPPSVLLRVTYVRRLPEPPLFPYLVASPTAGRQCRGVDVNASYDPSFNVIDPVWLNPGTGELRDSLPVDVRDRVRELAESGPMFGDNVLSEHEHGDQITNTRTGAVVALPGVTGWIGRQVGSVVAIGTTVVDLASARVLGELSDRPVAVDGDGYALMPAEPEANRVNNVYDLPIGPLHWVLPTPMASGPRTL